MDRQESGKWDSLGPGPPAFSATSTKITKSQLRDPRVLELATHGIVEVRTGGDEDVAMLPLGHLRELGLLQAQLQMFVKVTIAAGQTGVPRSLLEEVAFVADLSKADRERFLEDFAEE